MKKLVFVVFLFLMIAACKNSRNDRYTLVSYLDIKVDSVGNLPVNPYVVKYKAGKKELLVIGTQHTRDTLSPMFGIIEKLFAEFKPELVINEGGNLTKTFTGRNEAIKAQGELGLEKFLADKASIKTLNGDMNDKAEFEELSKAFSKEEALVFFASERFIFPYAFGQYEGDLGTLYDSLFIKKYLLKGGIVLTDEEKSFAYYKKAYKKYFKQDFTVETISQLDFTPFGKRHHFNDVTRKSKEIRDIALLKTIEAQMKLHDRVLVVFGGWHVLATEPALQEIMDRVNKK